MTAPHIKRERELRQLRDEAHRAGSDALIKAADLDALIETIDYERARVREVEQMVKDAIGLADRNGARAEAAEAERDAAYKINREIVSRAMKNARAVVDAEARIDAALALADEWSRECITGGGGDVMAADLRAALTVEEPTDG